MVGEKSGTRRDSADRTRSLTIVPEAGGWRVRGEASSRCTKTHATKAEAFDAAREQLRVGGGEVRVQGRDGRFREAVTLGRNAMTRISSVEGIVLDNEAIRELRSYDKAGLSSDQRRDRIAAKYAGTKHKR